MDLTQAYDAELVAGLQALPIELETGSFPLQGLPAWGAHIHRDEMRRPRRRPPHNILHVDGQ